MQNKERRRSRNLFERGFLILASITLLEGLFVVLLLLLEPSTAGNIRVLGYSLGRWLLIIANVLPLMVLIWLAAAVWQAQPTGLRLLTWLQSLRVQVFFLLLLTVIFFAALLTSTWGMNALRLSGQGFYGRLQPSLVWVTLASGQIWLALLITLREKIVLFFCRQTPLDEPVQIIHNISQPVQGLVWGSITIIYGLLQTISYLNVRQAYVVADSIDYLFPAQNLDIWTLKFWGYKKAAFTAAVYQLGGASLSWIDGLQVLVSTLAWLALAWVFARGLHHHWLKLAAFITILSFSLVPNIQIWNHTALSESLSMSMMALILALWIAIIQRWRWYLTAGLLLLLTAWVFTRESNAYIGLMIAVLLLPIGIFWRNQRFYWGVSLVLFLAFAANTRLSAMPDLPRHIYPLGNIILGRILPVPEYLAFFEGEKMPITPELLALSGGTSINGEFAIFNNPKLETFEGWLFKHGKETYVRFMLAHPGYTFISPLKDMNHVLASNQSGYGPPEYRPSLPGILNELLYPARWFWVYFGLSWLVVILALTQKGWREMRVFWLAVACYVLSIPHLYLSWLGDAAEIGRHAVQASVQYRSAVWLLFWLMADAFFLDQGFKVSRLWKPQENPLNGSNHD
ncbi:MAG: hypothetical protein JXA13_16190 [Anaerolineales bacterium]|nr:hypothetical protein [Anaerolineales bacterium]